MLLPDRVLRTVRKYGMVPRGGRVLIALSGGPDSVALTLIARELEDRGDVTVAGLAHLNHGLRPDADEDEAFCRRFAAELNVPFRSALADVRGLARERHTSLEDAGRMARYEFLARVADELGAEAVATGHTRDDQAETFLLRLLRGAGPRGLAGIFPVSGRVVRPLIEARREQLKAYLAERNRDYRHDPTNFDVAIPRNRIRHELIPLLQRDYTPALVDVLAREADLARVDEDYLRQKAIESAALIVLSNNSGRNEPATEPALAGACEVEVGALTSLHPAIASRVAQLALGTVSDRFVGFEHIQRFLAFARGDSARAELSLPGVQALRRGGRIVLVRERPAPFSNSFQFSLSIPGEVALTPQGWTISAEAVSAAEVGGGLEAERCESRGLLMPVQADRLALPLAVRSRRPGDRFRPAGMRGRKKLQDFLVDRKVPREMRDSLPLVVDSNDEIVWVVGQSVAEDFRVTEASQGVILLKARRLGGQG